MVVQSHQVTKREVGTLPCAALFGGSAIENHPTFRGPRLNIAAMRPRVMRPFDSARQRVAALRPWGRHLSGESAAAGVWPRRALKGLGGANGLGMVGNGWEGSGLVTGKHTWQWKIHGHLFSHVIYRYRLDKTDSYNFHCQDNLECDVLGVHVTLDPCRHNNHCLRYWHCNFGG